MNLRLCVIEDHVDLMQHDNCVQMISIKEILFKKFIQVMLENTFVFNIVTKVFHIVLLKINEFVKQTNILPIFTFFYIVLLERLLIEV